MQFAVAVLDFSVGGALDLPGAEEKSRGHLSQMCCSLPRTLAGENLSSPLENMLIIYSRVGQYKRCYIIRETLDT
jgi:hypothetical protein